MSEADGVPTSQPPPAGPPRRNGCAIAFLALIGFVLLFPGLCFLNLGGGSPLGLIGLVLSGAALFLFVRAAILASGGSSSPS